MGQLMAETQLISTGDINPCIRSVYLVNGHMVLISTPETTHGSFVHATALNQTE